jgi:hypothetical protein
MGIYPKITMKPEAQRIVIAEACGWLDKRIPTLTSDTSLGRCWISPIGRFHQTCPDYLNDLNAMHEAITHTIMGSDRSKQYGMHLVIIVLCYDFRIMPVAHQLLNPWELTRLSEATASQRAEAFLRTIGKWKE